MTTNKDVTVPDIGDFQDVEIVEVHVSPGDTVSAEDALVTLETDKAAMDVPAPESGTVVELRVKAGDRVSEGSVVLVLAVADEGAAPPANAPQAPAEVDAPAPAAADAAPAADAA
ncbi:MAG: biotin/lipoyl-containing protein, partial [Pseudomonadota bacterium]